MANLAETVKSALRVHPTAYPTERGLCVKHENGTEELLVFYSGLDKHEYFIGTAEPLIEEVQEEIPQEEGDAEEVESTETTPKKRGRKPKETTETAE